MIPKHVVTIDTREQLPLPLARVAEEHGLPFEFRRGTLKTADYALEGHEDLVLIERKTVGDLVGCVGHGRARFERELERLATACRWPVLLIAGSLGEITLKKYLGTIHPNAVLGSLASWSLDHRLRVIFGGSADAAAHFALRIFGAALRRFEREQSAAPTKIA